MVSSRLSAFSLVELAIVVAIIGLLVGGVITGQSLIASSNRNAVITEYTKYRTAFTAFSDKYSALPGDFNNAGTYWGLTNADPTVCRATASIGTSTCNGDGNAQIINPGEWYLAWKHLANAGLIEGNYTSIAGPANASYDALPGVNVPASKFPKGVWQVMYFSSSTSTYWYEHWENVFSIGAKGAVTSYSQFSLFTAEDALNLDTKLDDGKPGLGSVKAQKTTSGYIPTCTNNDNAAIAAYRTDLTGPRCSLMMSTGY